MQTNTEQVIENAVEEHGAFYLQAEFWVAFAFVLVVIALFKVLKNAGKEMLVKYVENIKSRIDEALGLKQDAQKLLSDYEKKFGNAKAEANEILIQSKKDLELLKKYQLTELDKSLKNKEKEALAQLENAQKRASDEVITLTSQTAITVIKKAIETKLDNKAKDKLIDNSIALITKL